jgi:carbonic anhydrase
MDNFDRIMENNLIWSEETEKKDPDFFNKLKNIQTPEYLWIGCSDSRVPANEVVGLKPG